MSILIKGMDMPKTCVNCSLSLARNEDVIQCRVMNFKKIIKDDVVLCRHEDCPLVKFSAEPKKGKWIEKDVIHKDEAQDVIEEWQSAKCSVCGKYHTTPYMYYFDEYKYCPNCGAKMIEEDE